MIGDLSTTLLSRPDVLGCPYHGLVRDGELILPNDAVIAYPQPYGTPGYPYQYGMCDVVRVPGAPGVERDEDAQARDAANGWQWRNYAQLAGVTRQLYGIELHGWVYVDPNGDRWLVTAPMLSGQMSDLDGVAGDVTLERFGVLGGDPEEHVYPVSLGDLQQSGPFVPAQYSPQIWVDSVSSDGSRAIAVMRRDINTSFADPQSRFSIAIGALLLEISGPGDDATLGLSVLRSRAQMFSGAQEIEDNLQRYRAWVNYEEEFLSGEEPPCESEAVVSIVATGITAEQTQESSNFYWVGDFSSSLTMECVCGLFFHPDTDAVTEITARLSLADQWIYPQVEIEETSGAYVIAYPHFGQVTPGGKCTYDTANPTVTDDDLVVQYGRTRTYSGSASLRISIGAAHIEYGMEVTGEVHTARRTIPEDNEQALKDHITDISGTLSGSGISDSASDTVEDHVFGTDAQVNTFFNSGLQPFVLSSNYAIWEEGSEGVAADLGFRLRDNQAQTDRYWLRHGYSNMMAGVYLLMPDAHRLCGVVHPAGTDAQIKSASADEPHAVYGSFNPGTGEAAWGHTTPVCWV